MLIADGDVDSLTPWMLEEHCQCLAYWLPYEQQLHLPDTIILSLVTLTTLHMAYLVKLKLT